MRMNFFNENEFFTSLTNEKFFTSSLSTSQILKECMPQLPKARKKIPMNIKEVITLFQSFLGGGDNKG